MSFIAKTPMAIVLTIPTLNDDKIDFIKLFRLWQQITTANHSEFIFEFSECRFLRQNAVAFLGGLARLIQSRGGDVSFAWNTLQEDIRANLAQSGFLSAFGNNQGRWQGNSIPYREDVDDSVESILNYLDKQWLGRDWVEVSQTIKDEIVCTVLEIYSNAFEHGRSNIGVFTCGQRYPNLNKLKLTAIDFGVGIPANVRQFYQNSNMLAEEALSWAFKPGTTTRHSTVPGGTGLDSLKKFVKSKQGKIEIYSHDGYALIDESQELYQSAPTFFEGTLINITIKCDINYYKFTENELSF